jgi:hypothetical protein
MRVFQRVLGILLIILIVAAGFGQAVLHLWNWLMPPIFGWRTITYWQALGLLGLSWIFFGGWRGPMFGMHRRHHMRERWEQMTPEQREAFRKGMRGRCGHFGPLAEEPKAKE